MREGTMARTAREKPSLLLALACAAVFFGGPARPAGGAEPLATHQALTALVSSRTQWLLTAPAEKGAGKKDATLLAFTADGDFYPIDFRKRGDGFRAHVQDHPAPSDLSAHVPPAQLPDGSFVGAGKSGMFINVDTTERRWLFVWPSVRPSPLSRPAVLNPSHVAMVGVDGSILLFQRTAGGKWAQSQIVGAKAARALPDAVLAAADLDGDGEKELILPAVPSRRGGRGALGDDAAPTEIHAYRFDGKSLRHMAAYPAGGRGVFEAVGVLAADLDGDGRQEILVTRSDPGGGSGGAAHLVLGMENGRLAPRARGGAGSRWSHLLGAFRIDGGAPKVLAVENPHRAGFLLALRLRGNQLRERARTAGFTTHAAGSRNLWRFALMRRRGIMEIVVQRIGGRRLSALALFGNRWHLRWSRPIPAPVRSNMLTADFNQDAKDDLAFVDQTGLVHIYLSR